MTSLQLVPLLPRGNLGKLLLRHALDEPLETGKHLLVVLPLENLALGRADELLDPRQALAREVLAQLVVDLGEDEVPEAVAVALGHVERLVGEARLQQLVGRDAPAHEEGLVGPRGAEPLDEGAAGAALGDEAEGGKGRQQKGVGRDVDKVGKGDEGGGEADDGAVEADDEDLGVGEEGLGRVEVVGDKGREPVLAVGDGIVRGGCLVGEGNVGAADGNWLAAHAWRFIHVQEVIR